MNSAISDLRSVMVMMDSLSVVEKRTTEKKTYAVTVTESAVLQTIIAYTGSSISKANDSSDSSHESSKSK